MCGRFDTTKLTWAEIHAQLSRFYKVRTAPQNLEPNDDVRPTQMQLTARVENDEWVLEKMRWGLVPFWRNGKPLKDTEKGKGDGFKLATFNARVESCHNASTFREAFAKRRCIVPATAWYEWTGDKGSKLKHTFSRSDRGTLWFAGLWDRVSTPDAGDFTSFTILTGPSEGWLAEFHSRAPVILEPDDWATWLDPKADPSPLFTGVRAERFEKVA